MADYVPYVCPFCREVAHYIRDDVTPDTMLKGDDFKHDPKLEAQGWELFPLFDHIVGANLVCGHCNNQLTVTGKPMPESMPQEWQDKYREKVHG